MKTFIVISLTNYGESSVIVNATNEDEARKIVEDVDIVWDGYDIEEINIKIKGIVYPTNKKKEI